MSTTNQNDDSQRGRSGAAAGPAARVTEMQNDSQTNNSTIPMTTDNQQANGQGTASGPPPLVGDGARYQKAKGLAELREIICDVWNEARWEGLRFKEVDRDRAPFYFGREDALGHVLSAIDRILREVPAATTDSAKCGRVEVKPSPTSDPALRPPKGDVR